MDFAQDSLFDRSHERPGAWLKDQRSSKEIMNAGIEENPDQSMSSLEHDMLMFLSPWAALGTPFSENLGSIPFSSCLEAIVTIDTESDKCDASEESWWSGKEFSVQP